MHDIEWKIEFLLDCHINAYINVQTNIIRLYLISILLYKILIQIGLGLRYTL